MFRSIDTDHDLTDLLELQCITFKTNFQVFRKKENKKLDIIEG